METILENTLRIGNFTSSEIVALIKTATDKKSFGKPALTYIDECNMERRLGLPLETEQNARPLTWGKLLEKRVFELLGLEYVLTSTETDQHPVIDCWAGSKDGEKFDDGKTVIDIKCPITRKSFCELVCSIYDMPFSNGLDHINYIRDNHKDGEKYYWQLVSNAIINNAKYAELIVYMPYKTELADIRELANNYDGPNQNRFAWINYAEDIELPYLNDDGYYKNLNIIRFEVPYEDKEFLTKRVLEAQKLLTPLP